MAFTRATLKAMGLTDEQVQSLIELHTETTDALKADIKKYKEEAEKLPDVQEQLNKAKSDLEAAQKDDYKGKYESEKAAHDKLKSDIEAEKTTAKKSNAFKAYLKEKGYSDTAITKITKYGGYVDGIELDDKDHIKDVEKLQTSIDTEWAEYKPEKKEVKYTPNVPGQQSQGGDDSNKPSKAAQIWADSMKAIYGENAMGGNSKKEG